MAHQVGIFQVMLLQRSAERVCSLLQTMEPFLPFRDPSRGPSCFDLQVYDCVRVSSHPRTSSVLLLLYREADWTCSSKCPRCIIKLPQAEHLIIFL